MIIINGKKINAGRIKLTDYLTDAGYDIRKIAVERNGEIVPKVQYDDTLLADGDVIEIVRFVGGG